MRSSLDNALLTPLSKLLLNQKLVTRCECDFVSTLFLGNGLGGWQGHLQVVVVVDEGACQQGMQGR